MKYSVVINKSEYGYDAHCPHFPECHSQGDTFEEAMENIKDAIKTYLQMIDEETKNASIYEVEVSAFPACEAGRYARWNTKWIGVKQSLNICIL